MSDRTGVDTDRSADPINVLFVDDDTQWAQLMAEDIETEADAITVTVAGSATECLEIFGDRDGIDCILADYQMPGTDGLQLLGQIRDNHPQFPFLLVTSQGSEVVAARATDAGVTDYLIKTVGGEQAPQFVRKIERAVAQYRLQRAIEESEQRYRTVTEQSRDGIAILQDGQLRFCNGRLTELTGRERASLQDVDVVAEVVHRNDQNRVRTVVDSWFQGEEQPQLQEARIVQPDGTVRHCEYTGGRVDYGGEAAVLVSIRDVTRRNRRERELRWERELNRTINEALAESRTRQSLEDRTTDQLRRHGYALAWVGEQVGEEVVPRSVGGDKQYVDAIDRSVDNDEPNGDPAVLATRTGEAQFYGDGDLVDLSSTAWTARAAQHGYRSGAAVPLVHNDITYGVLAVYHEQPDRFDETEQRLLGELADTIAFAVHSLETSDALAADQPLEVTVELSDGHYLFDLVRQGAFGDREPVDVEGTVPVDDETTLQYVEVPDASAAAVCEAVDESPAVREAAVVTDDDPARLQVTVTDPVPEAHLAARGVVVRSTTVSGEAVTLSFELETRADLRPTVDSLTEAFGAVSVRTIEEGTPGSETGGDDPATAADLTDKQLRALKAAYYNGYFEQPRESSATEVAETLGVSHPTFLHHLRAAQRKQFSLQFE